MWGACCFILLILCQVQGSQRIEPLVQTEVGLIRGLQAEDGDYAMFLGVPYAKVNEDNPFGEAQPYPKFTETFEALDDSAVCPQTDLFSKQLVGTLDCLHLNIYVPNKATSQNKLPVIVWIHGGGFSFGSGKRAEFGPKFLVRHDVVLVTINYRLGVYGFMCSDSVEVPGNQGLKDQYIALKWVKTNIASFGGDENKITVMGESAGSMSVDYHLLSKREKFFKRAILQSGSALCPKEFVQSDDKAAMKIAKHLGFETDNIIDAINFLSKQNEKVVISTTQELNMYFRACAEKDFENVEKFVSEDPGITTPEVKGISILMGYNSHEQMGVYSNDTKEFYDSLKNFLYNDGDEFVDEDNVVRHFYIGDEEISVSKKKSLIAFASDYKFNHPIQRSVIRYNQSEVESVYHYVFSYSGERKMIQRLLNIAEGGASHAEELGYLFDFNMFPGEPSPEDQLMIDRMTAMWTNFAKYGDPTPNVTDLLPVKWLPVSNYLYALNINTSGKMHKRPYHSRMAFWDLYLKAYPEKFSTTSASVN
ncbi:esterase FE4-like isoform X1 [Aricia agestis]|uniref:esterase FE4-like isoform X1 n=1 Tax=Aricia agestis TaxID=91739 RepID=UPI001C20B214|nr:esterase FE4-like isoform X1 [Aricia agestis]